MEELEKIKVLQLKPDDIVVYSDPMLSRLSRDKFEVMTKVIVSKLKQILPSETKVLIVPDTASITILSPTNIKGETNECQM